MPRPAAPTDPMAALGAFPKFGTGLCLPRILGFAAAEGLDLAALGARSLVVTGSKGKGGTAAFAAAALRAEGLRTGLFTSPHLLRLNERIALDGAQIPDAALLDGLSAAARFDAALPEGERLGAFEVLFLAAALHFAAEGAEALVWEAGIGGRFDPVRCLSAPVGVLTSVELEHAAILGPREDLIACDKLDAIPPGGVNVISGAVGPGLRGAIAAHQALAGRRSVLVEEEARIAAVSVDRTGTTAVLEGPGGAPAGSLRLAMPGAHQALNALAAARAVDLLAPALGRRGRGYGHAEAMADLRWPGRMERVSAAPELWIDVGHTPDSLGRTADALAEILPLEETLLVFGASEGKEIAAMAAALSGRFGGGVLLSAAKKHGAAPEGLAPLFARDRLRGIAADPVAAAAAARRIAEAEGRPVAVLGGLFLAVEFREAWEGRDPAALRFF